MSEEELTVPGLRLLNQWVRAQSQAWQKQVTALNEVWGDVLSDTNPKSVLQGYNKLCHVYAENTKMLWESLSLPLQAAGRGLADCPTLTFLLDHEAECSDRRVVPLPQGVLQSDVRHTPLKRVDAGTAAETIDVLDVAPHADGCSILVAVKDAHSPGRRGTYLSFIYSAKLPPPLTPIAVVLVTFLDPPAAPSP